MRDVTIRRHHIFTVNFVAQNFFIVILKYVVSLSSDASYKRQVREAGDPGRRRPGGAAGSAGAPAGAAGPAGRPAGPAGRPAGPAGVLAHAQPGPHAARQPHGHVLQGLSSAAVPRTHRDVRAVHRRV